MPFQVFQDHNFRENAEAQIAQANSIINEYRAQGYTLTLRQLYYQFVARDLIPNTQRSYKNLGILISKGRLAGRIDWNAIEDRTRNLVSPNHWDSPAQIIRSCADQFRIDTRATQRYRPEVWIEKEALVGVIAPVCSELDVAYFACRGYVSQSEQWRSGRRGRAYEDDGQSLVILHLGDHDPSGMDMTRDNHDRLAMFARMGVEVRRLALNMDQVEEYSPPPNPTKITDSRSPAYIEEYGDSSWELDALEPRMIDQLIRDAVADLTDEPERQAQLEIQAEHRERLTEIADAEEGA